MAQESQNHVITESWLNPILMAPKTPFLTLEDYAHTAAIDSGLNPAKFKQLIACESSWNPEALGDRETSFGILQFKEVTFKHFSQKYKLENKDINSPNDQIDLAAIMILNGHLKHWERCSKKIGWF